MEKKNSSILYFLIGVFTVMINWYYNHNVFYAILTWLFWPVYLIIAILKGNLSHGMVETIFNHYFK